VTGDGEKCLKDIDHGSLEKKREGKGGGKWRGEGRRGESCDCVLTLAVTLEANQFPR